MGRSLSPTPGFVHQCQAAFAACMRFNKCSVSYFGSLDNSTQACLSPCCIVSLTRSNFAPIVSLAVSVDCSLAESPARNAPFAKWLLFFPRVLDIEFFLFRRNGVCTRNANETPRMLHISHRRRTSTHDSCTTNPFLCSNHICCEHVRTNMVRSAWELYAVGCHWQEQQEDRRDAWSDTACSMGNVRKQAHAQNMAPQTVCAVKKALPGPSQGPAAHEQHRKRPSGHVLEIIHTIEKRRPF